VLNSLSGRLATLFRDGRGAGALLVGLSQHMPELRKDLRFAPGLLALLMLLARTLWLGSPPLPAWASAAVAAAALVACRSSPATVA
jgi:hypothetical protein